MLGFEDVTSHFIIRKMLAGAKKLYQTSDTRFPITVQILYKLVDSVHKLSQSQYEICLFKAMYILMFHGFLRIGEVTNSPNNIQYSQISVSSCSLTITFVKFKHHNSSPIVLTIPANYGRYCPVKLVKQYLGIRDNNNGPFFCFPGGIPVSSSDFNKILSSSVSMIGHNHLNIKPHSFRIGAATWAAVSGYSDSQIQAMGRWNSGAFRKYIRIQSFTVKV